MQFDAFNLWTVDCRLTPGLSAVFLRECHLILDILGSYNMLECKTLLATGGKKENIYYFAYFAFLLRHKENITAVYVFYI